MPYSHLAGHGCPKYGFENQKRTNLSRYGVKHIFSDRKLMRSSVIEKYGVINPSQNRKIFDRQLKSSFKTKTAILASGKKISLRGYEPQVLNYLISNSIYLEEDFEFEKIPSFKYGKSYYHPDLYVPKENRIIEIKSLYTYSPKLKINLLKKKSVLDAGYKFNFYLWNDSKKFLEIF